MLAQVAALMEAAPGTVDFQFDIFPDGVLGSVFAIDMQFGIEQPEAVQYAFEQGTGSRVMRLLENLGAADGRWRVAIQSAFARAIPARLADEGEGLVAFTLMPQWAKARWTNGSLQTSKLYHLARARLLD